MRRYFRKFQVLGFLAKAGGATAKEIYEGISPLCEVQHPRNPSLALLEE